MRSPSSITRNVFTELDELHRPGWDDFFLTPIILGSLGPSAYRVWPLAVSLTGYYGLLDLGVSVRAHAVRGSIFCDEELRRAQSYCEYGILHSRSDIAGFVVSGTATPLVCSTVSHVAARENTVRGSVRDRHSWHQRRNNWATPPLEQLATASLDTPFGTNQGPTPPLRR